MKATAIIFAAIFLLAAGATGGAIAAFKINAERIERLTGEKTAAEGARDAAVKVSVETATAALAAIARQSEIARLMGEIERELQLRAAQEREIAAAIRRAPPEDNGPVPRVVADTVRALYATRGAAP
ncbi:MAG: hypothetical protein Q7V31_03680 [Parvibaculum sp.]|uniref:hypothetical protein n=1 Tax=Parvibaculum sp. TaxID=2024848 RepID=UPI002718D729|nr:hypothetical protein [Parvibaculum sp.]MDO8838003.1 hypothetical protein [Parvibaculum sp.]